MSNPLPNPFFSFNKLFEGFQNNKTPYYIVTIISVFTLCNFSPFAINDFNWYLIYLIIVVVLLVTILITCISSENTEEEYYKQLKFSRSIGIASAVLCYFIAGEQVLNDKSLYWYILIPSLLQIVVFLFYIFIKDKHFSLSEVNDDSPKTNVVKKANQLQLCLITTSLLVGIAINSMLFKKNETEKTLTDLCFTANIQNLMNSMNEASLLSNETKISELQNCYASLKSMSNGINDVTKKMNKYISNDIKKQILNLEQTFNIMTDEVIISEFESVYLTMSKEKKVERFMNTRLIQLLIEEMKNVNSKKASINKIRRGYEFAENVKKQLNESSERLSNCLTPQIDSTVTGMLNSLHQQRALITELDTCYKEVKKLINLPLNKNGHETLRTRYATVNYTFVTLWTICILVWIVRLFGNLKIKIVRDSEPH